MRIVVDTNIVFSAILKSDSLISRIIMNSGNKLNFYSTDLLKLEIEEHNQKLLKLSGLSVTNLDKSISFISNRIRFIDAQFIPTKTLKKTEIMLYDIDINDVEFVALTDHIHGRLWSGDKVLINGLQKKNWKKFISTDELDQYLRMR